MPKKSTEIDSLQVYKSADILERTVQDCFHANLGKWLSESDCKLLTQAIASSRIFDNWLEKDELLRQRISYFFVPFMTSCKDKVVLLTYPLFLRDILENSKIDSNLHAPILFVTLPIAYYLFKDYPIHLVVDYDRLKTANKHVELKEFGGVIVSSEDVFLPQECIVDIASHSKDLNVVAIKKDLGLNKTAVSLISRGIFKSDEDERALSANMLVWHKQTRKTGFIKSITAGENGNIEVELEDGQNIAVSAITFDQEFVLKQPKIASKTYPVLVNGKIKHTDMTTIGDLIKSKLKQSIVFVNACKVFKVDPQQIDNLRIEICPLDDKFAETDLHVMKINEILFKDGDFFDEHFFIPTHEIVHWLSRVKENSGYFNDPEEVFGFVIAIAYEMEQGRSMEEIWRRIYPKISWHFHNESDAKLFFEKSIMKARDYVS
jgi:hypothetical protein